MSETCEDFMPRLRMYMFGPGILALIPKTISCAGCRCSCNTTSKNPFLRIVGRILIVENIKIVNMKNKIIISFSFSNHCIGRVAKEVLRYIAS